MRSLIVLAVALAVSSPAMAAKKKHVKHHKPVTVASTKQPVCVYPYQLSFFDTCEYRPGLLMIGIAP